MKLKVQRGHKKREGKVEREPARVFYMRLSQVRLKIQIQVLETTIVPACPNFTTGAHAILAHQDILGGWRVGLTNSSPVLNFEEERGRAPD